MVRVTKPSGHVCLEVYNSLNLKELWKKFRMLSWVEKLRPWGLNYDAYYSYRDYEKWAGDNFVSINKFSGAGWGFHFYILEMIHFRHLFPKFLQEGVFKGSLAIERVIRTMPFFSKTLEKVCMIGSVQKRKQKTCPLLNITDRLKTRNSRKIADRLLCNLESRNFAFMGSDMHHLRQTVDWLTRAQAATPDGGVSRRYSLLWNSRYRKAGWQPSYPETTGYIIPTMLKAATVLNDDGLVGRVKQMARWEMSIALPGGAVMGGNVSEIPKSALFDTGQVIRGFHALAKETGDSRYLDKAKEASRFIMNCEDGKSGHWMSNAAIQVDPESTTYYAYAVSPIVELGVEMDDAEMMDLGRRTGEHALAMQNEAGWVEQCCFTKAPDCLLHTLAYTFDGLWDMGKARSEDRKSVV